MSRFNITDTNQSVKSELTIKEIIFLLRRHQPLISIITFVVLIISILYTLIQSRPIVLHPW